MIGGKVNFIIDGQWGSTGKGKLAGYLALRHPIDIIIGNFMPNAGHTWVNDLGNKIVSKMIPTSAINKDAVVYLSPNSLIDVDRLLEEMEVFQCQNRLVIHPNAAVLDPCHKAREFNDAKMTQISSTLQGCGVALSDKIRRSCPVARDEARIKNWVRDWSVELHTQLEKGAMVLFESAQGFDLSLNWGHKYPHTTSRDVTIGSLINDAGINHLQVGDVYGSLRSFPIRVGNVINSAGQTVGHSGPHYEDQAELTWEEITRYCQCPHPLQEKTTVTGKIRRIFTFSCGQLIRFLTHCAPNHLFLNFVNYYNWADEGKKDFDELSDVTKERIQEIDDIASQWNCSVTHIGTGAEHDKMIERPVYRG